MRWRRVFRWITGVVFSLALAAIAGTLVPRPLWPNETASAPEGPTHRILVLSNPIHTDIAIRLDTQTRSRFAFLEDSGMPLSNPEARWLIFGWGGRTFYIETPTWADLKPVPVFKGLTIDRSVVHADVTREIVEPADYITGFDVQPDDYERLLSVIEASFKVENGRIEAIPDAAYGPNDRFFEAHGWFTALLGCNTWTAHVLREAGLRTGWWNPLPASLAVSLRLYN